jgi:hypothetical protein
MQIIRSIAARKIFKECLEIKKQLCGEELWSDGGYIGTVGEGTTSDIITNYVRNKGDQEEKQAYMQMKNLTFSKNDIFNAGEDVPVACSGVRQHILIEILYGNQNNFNGASFQIILIFNVNSGKIIRNIYVMFPLM